MSIETEWENQLKDFFRSEGKGQNAIVDAVNKYFETSVQESNIVAVKFHGLDLTSLAFLWTTIQKSPVQCLLRCHDILNECRELDDFKSLFPGKSLPSLRFRLYQLPANASFQKFRVPQGEEIGTLIEFSGTVVKVKSPRVFSTAKSFVCGACKNSILIRSDPEQYNICVPPGKCSKCSQYGSMRLVADDEEGAVYMSQDHQEIKVQEKLSNIGVGCMPRSIWVCLDEDLVDKCKPGDDVRVVGVVIRRWSPLGKGADGQTDIQLALLANYIQVLNDQLQIQQVKDDQREKFEKFWSDNQYGALEARNEILASFCPQVYGLYIVKLAITVTLCGGIERLDQSGTRVRGEPHMLMVGDPGTGKSQILRYAAKLTPRSVMTSGIGSTSAGLTVSAIRDGGQWSLEAGALVLADGGVCCIDEFGSIREHDRVAIHEAMEQQSVSVAKAGVVTRLHTRCSVIATSNPKGKYDPEMPITINVGLASPLLSRFDLVYVLLDSKNSEWDKVVSSYILTGVEPWKEASNVPLWTFDEMKAFFAFCRQKVPKMSPDASKVLARYYQKQRSSDTANMARTTIRLLQSTIRLAQGHARLMNHNEVTICDAIHSILLLELSFDSNPIFLPETNPLHTTFPENATEEYATQAEYMLTALALDDLWQKEAKRLKSLKRPKPTKMIFKHQSSEAFKRPRDDTIVEDGAKKRKLPSHCTTKDKLRAFQAPTDNDFE